jgi:DNA-binding transcriptional regulator YhcF (GntR family)
MLSASVNITVNIDSPVPLRDQLVEQIGLQIASGVLQGNDKLPSIRAMAQKLGIHHGIVNSAYNQLAEIGMLDIRHGSGVRVMPKIGLGQSDTNTDLHSLLMKFIENAIRLGYSLEEIDKCYQQFSKRAPIKNLLLIDGNPDFHPVIASELKPHFALPILLKTVEQLKADPSLLNDALVVTSLYHFLAAQSLPIDPTRFLICNVEPAQDLVNRLKTLPQSSLVVLVSVSPTLLEKGLKMAAAVRGESIAVRTVLVDETKELEHVMKFAKLVICDLPSKEKVLSLANKVPVCVFNLYSPATIQLIKESLTK